MKQIKFLLLTFLVFGFISCKKSSTPFILPPPPPPVVAATNPAISQTFLNAHYGNDPQQTMDVYLPAGRSTATTKVMMMIHGGAWTQGDKNDFSIYIDSIKNRFPDYAIFNMNYRLCDYVSKYFPTQETDIKDAVAYIYQYEAQYFISNKFVLMGASAGGHLALLQAYKYHTPVQIKAVIDYFGPTDMKDMYDHPPTSIPASTIALLVGGSVASTPSVNPGAYQQSSPLFFVNSQSCPTIILQGGTDPLVNHVTQSEALRDKLNLNAIPNEYVYFPLGDHGGNWTNANNLEALNKIQAFLTLHVL